MKQAEMTLFGSAAPLAAEVAKCVAIKPRYQYHKVKRGKKWVVERDIANNPVLELDAQGQPIATTQRIALLPRSSKDNPDLKGATGLTGQGLFAFERSVRDGLMDAALSELQRLRATGQYTFGAEVRNLRTGAITLTVKPVFGGKSVVASPDEELQREMERRGYTVTKEPKEDNGETEAPALPAPVPAKPAKGKKA